MWTAKHCSCQLIPLIVYSFYDVDILVKIYCTGETTNNVFTSSIKAQKDLKKIRAQHNLNIYP